MIGIMKNGLNRKINNIKDKHSKVLEPQPKNGKHIKDFYKHKLL